MAKIFIDFNNKDYQSFEELSSHLKHDKHEILTFDKDTFKSYSAYFDMIINNAEVIILLISADSINSNVFINTFNQLRNFVTHSNDKLLIPVLLPSIDFNILPTSLRNFTFIRVKSIEKEEFKKLAETINSDINRFIGIQYAKKEKAQEIKKNN